MSEGSWTWSIVRCWWLSWIQRALQLVQNAIGYRPKVMVTRADPHSGQRGMRSLYGRAAGAPLKSVLKAVSVAGASTAGELGGVAGLGHAPGSTQLGVVSSPLLAAGMSVRPGRTWMRLGLASSILGTRICSTPLSTMASICSAITWAGRVIERRKAP